MNPSRQKKITNCLAEMKDEDEWVANVANSVIRNLLSLHIHPGEGRHSLPVIGTTFNHSFSNGSGNSGANGGFEVGSTVVTGATTKSPNTEYLKEQATKTLTAFESLPEGHFRYLHGIVKSLDGIETKLPQEIDALQIEGTNSKESTLTGSSVPLVYAKGTHGAIALDEQKEDEEVFYKWPRATGEETED